MSARTTKSATAPSPKVTKCTYSMTVKVGGRPARHFSGASHEQFDRDLAAAAAEIGAGAAEQNGGRRG